jgi:hypothetical protein
METSRDKRRVKRNGSSCRDGDWGLLEGSDRSGFEVFEWRNPARLVVKDEKQEKRM